MGEGGKWEREVNELSVYKGEKGICIKDKWKEVYRRERGRWR